MLNFEKLQFSFDWLNGTLPFYSVRAFFDKLEDIHPDLAFREFHSRGRGLYNYSESFGLMGDNRFVVAFNPDYDNYVTDDYHDSFGRFFPLYARSDGFNPGIFVSISGDGLRYLNSLGSDVVLNLFKFFQDNRIKVSRLDVACDIYDSENDVVSVLYEAFTHCINKVGGIRTVVSNMRKTPENLRVYMIEDPYRKGKNPYSFNVQFGNHGSSWGMFRMYDKWLEVKTGRLKHYADELLNGIEYWYRLEYELHKQHANDLFYQIGKVSTAEIFGYAASDMFKIVVPKSEKTQTDKCDSCSVWTEFMEFVSSSIHFVQLVTTPYIEKSVNNTKNWVLSLSKAFYAVFALFEADPEFKDQAMREGYSKYCDDLKYAPFRREIENLKGKEFF